MEVDKKFYEAIAAGIADGFKEIGFTLDKRDEKIIFFTTIAAITIRERFDGEKINDEG